MLVAAFMCAAFGNFGWAAYWAFLAGQPYFGFFFMCLYFLLGNGSKSEGTTTSTTRPEQ